eukprot:TRINITY_DN5234_c0_g1_i2.p1 TRINITY_DN5234_c0_g1~~TRINITY_DN5234_c0_g1_i2.p1  ORF type:complete len:291 (+),score=72.90 TRINITY_DN5234_c0_g1_i2:547-1419(+)
MLGKYKLRELLKETMPKLKLSLYQLDKLIDIHIPRLSKTFRCGEISAELFAVQWFVTVFSYDIGWPELGVVWDLFLHRGWKFAFQLAIAILREVPLSYYEVEPEVLISYIKNVVKVAEMQELVRRALRVKITNKQLRILEGGYSQTQPRSSIRKKLSQKLLSKDDEVSLELSQVLDTIVAKPVYSFPAKAEHERLCETARPVRTGGRESLSGNFKLIAQKYLNAKKRVNTNKGREEEKVNQRAGRMVAYKLPVKAANLESKVPDEHYSRNLEKNGRPRKTSTEASKMACT